MKNFLPRDAMRAVPFSGRQPRRISSATASRHRPFFFCLLQAAHIVASFALKTSRRGTRDLLIAYHTPQALANLLSELETHHGADGLSSHRVGLHGGTFTALPERLQMECLALAMQAKEKGIVCRVRCSTRALIRPPGSVAGIAPCGTGSR